MNVNENKTSSDSQCAKILAWLKAGGTITSLEALYKFGCLRLASRISDLRERGHSIDWEWETTDNGKRVKRYSIAQA